MGRPFAVEMTEIPRSCKNAESINIDHLINFVKSISDMPLIAVGSGGSLSAAAFMAHLHQHYTGNLSKFATPLEISELGTNAGNTAICFISSSGKNVDIKEAFEIALLKEYTSVMAICGRTNSPLHEIAKSFSNSDIFSFDLENKDGFLATNSLITFFILLRRAYREVFNAEEEMLDFQRMATQIFDRYKPESTWSKKYFITLYDPKLLPVAIDFESKLTEAALGSAQLADLRNFGHGRHHWLAKYGNETAVILFTTDNMENLSDRTLSLIPNEIDKIKIKCQGDFADSIIYGLLSVFYMTKIIGENKGIDPGRPGVPEFGRKLYHLTGGYKSIRKMLPIKTQDIAIHRKLRTSPKAIVNSENRSSWEKAYNTYINRLNNSSINGIVMDYDGTLCGEIERYGFLRKEIVDQINRLVSDGVYLGIATGRGRSVREPLALALSSEYWDRVIIGYYNGAECRLLSEHLELEKPSDINEEIRSFAEYMEGQIDWLQCMDYSIRPHQITIMPKSSHTIDEIWEILFTSGMQWQNLKLVRSTHSIDLIPYSTDKRNVIKEMVFKWGISENDILCIGDQGRWPGNDFELLTHPLSLSVDQVSPDKSSCWNILPPGKTGVEGTLIYLKSIHILDDQLVKYARFQLVSK